MEDKTSACGHCGKEASKRCGGCRNMHYCTPECQQADWQFHKLLCKSFAKFAQKPRPDVCRAIFFPDKGDKPYFIWLPVESGDRVQHTTQGVLSKAHDSESLGVPDADPDARQVFPAKGNPLGRWQIDNQLITLVCGKLRSGELLDYSIMMMVGRDFQKHPTNQCLKRLANLDVDPVYFRGPLVVFAMNKVRFPTVTVDIDTVALTLALDATTGRVKVGAVPSHAQKVKAIKVNTKSPFFEELEVPKRHPAFKSNTRSEAAEVLAVSPRIWSYPASNGAEVGVASSGDKEELPPFDPKILHLCMNTASPDFGHVPASIQADKRSELVVPPSSELAHEFNLALFMGMGRTIEGAIAVYLSGAMGGTPAERLEWMHAAFTKSKQKDDAQRTDQSGKD